MVGSGSIGRKVTHGLGFEAPNPSMDTVFYEIYAIGMVIRLGSTIAPVSIHQAKQVCCLHFPFEHCCCL